MKRKSNTLIMFLLSISPLMATQLWSLFGIESAGAIYYTEKDSRVVDFVEPSQIDYGDKRGL